MTVPAPRRRTHRNENRIRTRHRRRQVRREGQTTRPNILRNQILKTRLVNRDLATLKTRNLLRVPVNADH